MKPLTEIKKGCKEELEQYEKEGVIYDFAFKEGKQQTLKDELEFLREVKNQKLLLESIDMVIERIKQIEKELGEKK